MQKETNSNYSHFSVTEHPRKKDGVFKKAFFKKVKNPKYQEVMFYLLREYVTSYTVPPMEMLWKKKCYLILLQASLILLAVMNTAEVPAQ